MTYKEREKDILQKEKKWEREKKILEREYALKEEKKNFKQTFKKRLSNSKLLIWFLFINCTLIELFTGWVIVKEIMLAEITGNFTPDLAPLLALISSVVAEVIGFAIYALKSAKENTEGGIVYETAMRALEHSNENQGVG